MKKIRENASPFMDLSLDNTTLSLWLINYGSFVLFALLTLGIIAFPVPEETLMVIAGVLMCHGKLNFVPTVIATLAGSMCGISISYLLGRTAGNFLIHKFGGWIGITEQKLNKAHSWFERFGKWTLLFGYFIPGIRHFTGFSAGTTKLEFKTFALFAYTGALVWVSMFLSVGYFFGTYWLTIYEKLELDLEKLILLAIGILAVFFVFYMHKKYGEKK